MTKAVRINIYIENNLEDLSHLFYEAFKKKNLIGLFIVNFLNYLKNTYGKEKTEKFIREIAQGNFEILKNFLQEYGENKNEESLPCVKDPEVDLENFLL